MAKYPDVTAGQTEACINRFGGWDNFLRFIGGQGRVVFDSILEFVRTLIIPAQPELTTSEKFFEDAGVKWMSETAKSVLLNRKVEACGETELRVSRLLENSIDEPILDELGDKAEISPTQLAAFLDRNRESSEWFIFYVLDEEGTLWAVRAYWFAESGGWRLSADSVTSLDGWFAGSQVVSRN